jgi:hypothetical protein
MLAARSAGQGIPAIKTNISFRLFKNIQMQGARNHEE